MSIFEMLGTVLLGPLKLVFEIIFSVAWGVVGNPGLAIIVLSLCMNTLLMPLYKRADAIQIEARDTEAKMKPVSDHIKKTFTGDERMMLMQTHYRQNNYSPLSALNGSVSLLLEIPFFMAAYQFLSNLDILDGVAFGPIADLSQPDGLIKLGAITINFLPILMTLINVVSSTLYLKGFPLKTKIQLYGMALAFLVLLYDSPSALVFYWTLNNTYSLGKTLFNRIPHAGKILSVLLAAAGTVCVVFNKTLLHGSFRRLLILLGLVMLLPLAIMVLKRFLPKGGAKTEQKANTGMYVCGALFLTVLVGLLIPSTYIAASPLEYVDVFYFYHPVWFIVRTSCIAAGTFLVWMSVFYWLANPAGKRIFCRLVWILCGVMLMNYMFFGTKLGILSPDLKYEAGMVFSSKETLINFAAMFVLAIVLCFIHIRWPRSVGAILLTGAIALSGMSAVNIVKTVVPVNAASDQDIFSQKSDPHFSLSKDGENVVVIMLDRAMGQFIPYLFNENPELEKQFEGFAYYSNTISYGASTNFASPALYGGYEYTPVELNKRDSESLASKQNEALKVMPVLFAENGYDVTVFDPAYANYQWIPDLSIYDEYPEIEAYNSNGAFDDMGAKETILAAKKRNFFCFSIMKTMPVFIQRAIYDGGRYNQAVIYNASNNVTVQVTDGVSTAQGMSSLFLKGYNVLLSLPKITQITEGTEKNFLMLTNKTTHEPMLLQEPEYVPAETVDNTQYDLEHADRFTLDGKTMDMSDVGQMSAYQTNMAAMIQLGNWFDYLRENDLYDNTKIVLVSDHGKQLFNFEELDYSDDWNIEFDHATAETYYPLLMVKDFNSDVYTVSDAFMTNADVPTLTFEGVIEDPVNPFTGNAITDEEKTAHEQYIIVSDEWDAVTNIGNTFLPGYWARVSDNLWEEENWEFYGEKTVLQEHAFP